MSDGHPGRLPVHRALPKLKTGPPSTTPEIALFAELPLADADDLASSIARQVTAGFAQLDGAPVRVSAGVVGAKHDPGVGAPSLLDAAARVLAAAKRAAA